MDLLTVLLDHILLSNASECLPIFSLCKKSFPLLFTWVTPTSPSGVSSVGLPLGSILFPPNLSRLLWDLVDHWMNFVVGPL